MGQRLTLLCFLLSAAFGCRSGNPSKPKVEDRSKTSIESLWNPKEVPGPTPYREPFYDPEHPPPSRTAAHGRAVLADLRLRFLKGTPSQAHIEHPGAVWGVVMDASFLDGRGTILVLQDGSGSFHTVDGKTDIGGAAYPIVKEGAAALCAAAAKQVVDTRSTTDFPYPPLGRARFHFLTPSGVRSVEADEKELQSGKHRLSDVFTLGQRVRDELRHANYYFIQ